MKARPFGVPVCELEPRRCRRPQGIARSRAVPGLLALPANVGYRGKLGKRVLTLNFIGFDPFDNRDPEFAAAQIEH